MASKHWSASFVATSGRHQDFMNATVMFGKVYFVPVPGMCGCKVAKDPCGHVVKSHACVHCRATTSTFSESTVTTIRCFTPENVMSHPNIIALSLVLGMLGGSE